MADLLTAWRLSQYEKSLRFWSSVKLLRTKPELVQYPLLLFLPVFHPHLYRTLRKKGKDGISEQDIKIGLIILPLNSLFPELMPLNCPILENRSPPIFLIIHSIGTTFFIINLQQIINLQHVHTDSSLNHIHLMLCWYIIFFATHKSKNLKGLR